MRIPQPIDFGNHCGHDRVILPSPTPADLYFDRLKRESEAANAKFARQEEQRRRREARQEQRMFNAAAKKRISSLVYCITAEDMSAVKFGYSGNPRMRLNDLQCNTPLVLRLDAQLFARQWLEFEIHRLMAPSRIRGEWYRPTEQVLSMRAWMQSEGAQKALDAWSMKAGQSTPFISAAHYGMREFRFFRDFIVTQGVTI